MTTVVCVPANAGWVEVVVGCMFSGKTEELVRRLRRAPYAKQKVASFKPVIDARYHKTHIQSHGGISIEATPVKSPEDILRLVGDAQVVGIDEAQFFDETLVDVVQELAREGRRVIVAGLDLDYRGVPFGPIPHIMAVAEYVTKVHALCTVCGAPASRSQRVTDSDNQVLVGGATAYEARCRKHWSPQPTFSESGHMDMLED